METQSNPVVFRRVTLRPPPGTRFAIFGADCVLEYAEGREAEIKHWLGDWIDSFVLPLLKPRTTGANLPVAAAPVSAPVVPEIIVPTPEETQPAPDDSNPRITASQAPTEAPPVEPSAIQVVLTLTREKAELEARLTKAEKDLLDFASITERAQEQALNLITERNSLVQENRTLQTRIATRGHKEPHCDCKEVVAVTGQCVMRVQHCPLHSRSMLAVREQEQLVADEAVRRHSDDPASTQPAKG